MSSDTYYLIGTAAGPHPYPELVRDFQSVIGNEAREQILKAEGRVPDMLIASMGGGSNAIGLFHPFLDDKGVANCRCRSWRPWPRRANGHSASLTAGGPAFCMATEPICCRMMTARFLKAIPSPPVSIIRALAQNIPG